MISARSAGTSGQTRTFLSAGSIATAAALLCSCGGGDGTASVTPGNAVPQITSLSPDSATAEDAPFILTVSGTAFQLTSSVLWNDTVLSTTYVSAAQLTAEVSSAEIANAGTANIKVRNAASGGGTSAAAVFTINAPRSAPSLVQFAQVQTTNADFENDSTVQFPAPTRTGDAIWVAVTVPDFGGVHGISVSDTQGNAYTLLDQKNDGQPGTQTVAHFYAANIVGDNGTPDTVTVHWSSDNYKGILAGEIAGVTGAPLVGHSANIQDGLNAGTNNVTSGAIPVSSAQTPALLVALSMNTTGGDSDTGGSGFGGPAAGAGFVPRTVLWNWGTNLATLETSSITAAGNAVPLFNAPNTDSYLTVAAVFH